MEIFECEIDRKTGKLVLDAEPILRRRQAEASFEAFWKVVDFVAIRREHYVQKDSASSSEENKYRDNFAPTVDTESLPDLDIFVELDSFLRHTEEPSEAMAVVFDDIHRACNYGELRKFAEACWKRFPGTTAEHAATKDD